MLDDGDAGLVAFRIDVRKDDHVEAGVGAEIAFRIDGEMRHRERGRPAKCCAAKQRRDPPFPHLTSLPASAS
jgi:hypothetical protein